jgi:hypothetical protein
MSNDDYKDPPKLSRTLSEHHWVVANIEMAQKRTKLLHAGNSRDWDYQIIRANTKTRNVKHETLHNSKIVTTTNSVLPKARRCAGRSKHGRRCKRKVFWKYCRQHSPWGDAFFQNTYEKLYKEGIICESSEGCNYVRIKDEWRRYFGDLSLEDFINIRFNIGFEDRSDQFSGRPETHPDYFKN